MGQVYQFRKKKTALQQVGYVISLYTQQEVDLCIVALNRYTFSRFKAHEFNLAEFDPQMIILCLSKLSHDPMFDRSTRDLAKKILSVVQAVPIQRTISK
jgi:hypothetical protein